MDYLFERDRAGACPLDSHPIQWSYQPPVKYWSFIHQSKVDYTIEHLWAIHRASNFMRSWNEELSKRSDQYSSTVLFNLGRTHRRCGLLALVYIHRMKIILEAVRARNGEANALRFKYRFGRSFELHRRLLNNKKIQRAIEATQNCPWHYWTKQERMIALRGARLGLDLWTVWSSLCMRRGIRATHFLDLYR